MNKYQKLATNTLIFSIGSFGSKILSVLLIRLYSGILSTTEISTTELFTQTANLLIPIATLRISEAVMRFGMDDEYSVEQVYTSGVLTNLLGLIIVFLFLPLLNLLPDFKGTVILMGIYLFTSSFRELNQYFLRSRGLVKLFAVDGILTTLTMLVFNIVFLVYMKLGVTGYILSIICSDGFSCLFMVIMGKNFRFIKPRSVNKDVLQTMTRYSIPLIPTFILWWVVSASDRYMVRYMIDADTNGLYSMAYKIPTLISIASTIFYQAWQMSAISEYNSEGARKFYSKVFEAYQSMMYIASGGILLFLQVFTNILIDEKMRSSYQYAPFLVIGVLMSCFCQFLSSVYSASKSTKNSFWTSMIAAVANIALNFLLIPLWGAQGAGVATMISYGACFFVRIFDTRKFIAYNVDWQKIVFNLTVLLAMCFCILFNVRCKYPLLTVMFLAILAVNFMDIMQTVKKLISRKKPEKQAG